MQSIDQYLGALSVVGEKKVRRVGSLGAYERRMIADMFANVVESGIKESL